MFFDRELHVRHSSARDPIPDTLEEYLALFDGAAPGSARARPRPAT